MRFGISCFLGDKSISIIDLAREVEDRGFDDLWLPEHTHIPTGRETDWPMDGGELPEEYRRCVDPFTSLAAAAVTTTTLRLGTAISLVGQHHPINLAKTVSTLDHLSGGRFTLGVGFGWNVDEMRHHGVNPDKRRTTGREHVLAMKELWTKEEAEFHGGYVDFGPSWQWPKPLQQPHPPIYVGGGRSTLRHAVEYGDGWMPIEGAMPIDRLTSELRGALADAGRRAEDCPVYVANAEPDPQRYAAYVEAGVAGMSMWVSWDGDLDTIRAELDEVVKFRESVS